LGGRRFACILHDFLLALFLDWRCILATATARKVDEDHYKTLTDSAKRNGQSISAELRDWIAEGAQKRKAEKTILELRKIREQTKGMFGPNPDSVALIRAIRDDE
jgi:hypothetical protein